MKLSDTSGKAESWTCPKDNSAASASSFLSSGIRRRMLTALGLGSEQLAFLSWLLAGGVWLGTSTLCLKRGWKTSPLCLLWTWLPGQCDSDPAFLADLDSLFSVTGENRVEDLLSFGTIHYPGLLNAMIMSTDAATKTFAFSCSFYREHSGNHDLCLAHLVNKPTFLWDSNEASRGKPQCF